MGHDLIPSGDHSTVHANRSLWVYGKLRMRLDPVLIEEVVKHGFPQLQIVNDEVTVEAW